MTKSHFIVDVDFSYQHEDLPAIASHNIHIELRPGLDGVKVREAIEKFIQDHFVAEPVGAEFNPCFVPGCLIHHTPKSI